MGKLNEYQCNDCGYTILDDLPFLDESKVNWESEESKKVFWDNYSVFKTAVDKAIQRGVQIEKVETIHRMQAMGLSIEQIAYGADMKVDEVKKLLQ